MPIYEFYCPDNHKIYQFLARTQAHRDRVPRCPDNPAFTLQKQVSRFAIIGRAKETAEDDPFAGIDESKMEALMADMERDMAGLDDDNPDPRQLGHFMRKMTDVMGDRAPPELREIVRRLEAGEDPEKLESEFGSLDEADAGDALFTQVKTLIRTTRAPARDPKLYELAAYLEDN